MRREIELNIIKEGTSIIGMSYTNSISFNRRWRAFFGCSVKVCVLLWDKLVKNKIISTKDHRHSYCHLLWALILLKVYDREAPLCKIVGGITEKTWRKHSWMFVGYLSNLESAVVSLLVFSSYISRTIYFSFLLLIVRF